MRSLRSNRENRAGSEGVKHAEVDHNTNSAVVTLKTEIEDSVLKKAVEDKGYTVTEIK